MSNSFGAPNTQGGFTLGTATQPAGGGTTGFTFGAATAGAGDANKPAPGALPQTGIQGQANPNIQPFGASFATPKFGAPATGTSTFGASPSGMVGFGQAPGTPGIGLTQPRNPASNVPAPTNTAMPGGLTFGTPIGTSTAQTSQPVQLSFQTAGAQPTGLGLGSVSAPSGSPGFNFGGNSAATTTSALSFNPAGAPATSGTPTTGGINFGIPRSNVSGLPSGTAPATSSALPGLSFATPGLGATQTPTSTTGFSIAGAGLQIAPNTGSAPAGTTPAASSAGGFNLSGTQTQIAQTTGGGFNPGGTATITPASATASGFLLATPASGSSSFPLSLPPSTTQTALALPAAPPAFELGGATAAASTPGFTLGKSAVPPAATAPAASAAQTSLGTATNVTSSNVGASQPAGLNFCQLEESINKWTLELEEQEKAFVNQATQVNAWDRLLIANGEKIVTLNQEVERVKLEQQQLEHELDYVVGQQRELQDCLVPLEKELSSVSASDPERDYTYRLAENLDTQLKQMSEDLKEIIEHLNEANRSQDSSDPIVQIGKILNAHMNSLQWLDQRTAVLQTKIQQIDQLHQNFRQEHERSFSLAYN